MGDDLRRTAGRPQSARADGAGQAGRSPERLPNFIVGGLPRSGTTLIASLIGAQDGVAMFPGEVMPQKDVRYRRLSRRLRAQETFIRRNLACHLTDGSPEEFRRTGIAGSSDQYRAFVAFLEWWRERHHAAAWAFKHPNAEFHCDAILRLVPAIRFVYMVRDPRDVFVSLRSRAFLRGRSAVRAAMAWRASVERARHLQQAWPGQVSIIRYEDLVRRPEREARRILDRFRVFDDQDRLRLCPYSGFSTHNSAFVQNGEQGLFTSGIGRHIGRTSPTEKLIFEMACGELLRDLGYEDAARSEPSPRLRVRAQARLLAELPVWRLYGAAASAAGALGLQPLLQEAVGRIAARQSGRRGLARHGSGP